MTVVKTEPNNVMANSEELIGTIEYLTLYAMCRINRCRYNRFRLYFAPILFVLKYTPQFITI